ncbi:superinfection immunity protein [Ochrobactrum tritici]|nr:superinfection immunity protein [Brucella tritici]
MPTIFAFRHRRPDSWAILIINTAFGWTLIGWIGSMFWSLAPVHRQ